jgi:hypothetical protein
MKDIRIKVAHDHGNDLRGRIEQQKKREFHFNRMFPGVRLIIHRDVFRGAQQFFGEGFIDIDFFLRQKPAWSNDDVWHGSTLNDFTNNFSQKVSN